MSANPHPARSASPQEQTLETLLQRLTTYYPRGIDPNLERSFRLLADLGNPQDRLPPVIHIAGTNGKGSTLATMRAIAEAAGLSCHVMTSPHLVRFNERLVVAGEEIPTDTLISILEETERLNAKQPTTSFELTTAAGLLAFSRTPADLCLLETGMGGRLDATNVVRQPLATVITVISYDHMQYLGTTLPQIAGEKAAIMKPGSPCIIGPQTGEGIRAGVMDVFADYAEKIGAPLYRHGYNWSFEPASHGFVLHTGTDTYDFPRPNLLGPHQIGNAATAAMTVLSVAELLPKPVAISAYDEGITHVHWPARLQRLGKGPLPALLAEGWELWLDGGHNDTGGQVLGEQAEVWAAQDGKPLHLIAGMLSTKDPSAFLKPLAPHLSSARAVTVPDQPLSMTAPELAVLAKQRVGLTMTAADSVAQAVRTCIGQAQGKPGRILIAGSLYLAGTVLSENA